MERTILSFVGGYDGRAFLLYSVLSGVLLNNNAHQRFCMGKHPNDIIAYLAAIWTLPFQNYPYEIKRIMMDDLLNAQSADMRDMTRYCLEFEIRKLSYKLAVMRALHTIVSETEEILEEISAEESGSPSSPPPVLQSSVLAPDSSIQVGRR